MIYNIDFSLVDIEMSDFMNSLKECADIKNEKDIKKNCTNISSIKTSIFDNNIYEKLKEAESEINNTSKRYSKEEILESMNNIIG